MAVSGSLPVVAPLPEPLVPAQLGVQIPQKPARTSLPARGLALVTLCAVLALFLGAGHTAYRAARDSFVTPAILSPDSDLVLDNKLKLSELEVERVRASAELEGVESDIAAAEKATGRLEQLRGTVTTARKWTSAVTSQKASASAAERSTLYEQRRMMTAMLEKQKTLTEKAESELASGLISRSDYMREMQAQNHLELALLDNTRAAMVSESSMYETNLTVRALAMPTGAPLTPELLTRQEQLIRLELELERLSSELRSKSAHRRGLTERIAKLDELSRQLRSRPLFRAIASRLSVAFTPYTQLEGVRPGAGVYSCIWGLFFCRRVGAVTEVLPGEVVQADAWGNQARGQYAVLDLRDQESAKAKTLRIRPPPGGSPVPALSAR